MKIKTLLFTLSIAINFLHAQDLHYGHNIIDTLCSPQMHGRGYVDYGAKIAAEYISKEYESIGLQKLNNTYLQKFEISVNTLPGDLELKISQDELRPGVDYLVEPGAPNTNGTFSIRCANEWDLLDNQFFEDLKSNSENQFIAVLSPVKVTDKADKDTIKSRLKVLKYDTIVSASGIIYLSNKKLTWRKSTKQFTRPVLLIKEDATDLSGKISTKIESRYFEKYETQNVVGFLPGKSDSIVLLSAHYDHLGRMGKDTYFPGANDNASGTAMMMDLAKHYAELNHPPKYSMLFIACGAEELGLFGSEYFVKNPLYPLNKIKFQINLDICGTGDNGIQVVNGTLHKAEFDCLLDINSEKRYLEQIKIRGESCNSDHCWFEKKGVPAFFIYTLGGAGHYHDVYDIPENLTLGGYVGLFKLLTDFVEEM